MSAPITCIKKPEAAEHTPGPWRSQSEYGRKSPDDPLVYCGEYIKAGDLFVASTWSNKNEAQTLADGRLIAAAPALLAQAEKCLRWMLTERDCYYEGCASRGSGYVHDPGDRETLDLYDKDIDELRAVIAAARGEL